MKLGICYTVFDGLEFLKKSIENIFPCVDVVIICYQEISNKGNINKSIESWLVSEILPMCLDKNISLVRYDTDTRLNPKENERRKHQLMIDTAKLHECTHFIMAATDHFYEQEQIEFAKKYVIDHDYDVTFTHMFTYYKKPTWQIYPIESYHMPFICKLYEHTKIERVKYFPIRVDPSVQVNTFQRWYLFDQKQVMLHHYSMVRKDIRGKLENAASPWKESDIESFVRDFENFDFLKNEIMYYPGRKVKNVPDYFDLSSVNG